MLTGIGIVCFAGSYTVALLLELSRLFFRSAVRGVLLLGWAGAGLFAHSVYLYQRAVTAQGLPLSSERDWYLLAAWGLAAVYLYLTFFHPRTSFGLLLLPLILALLAVAAFVAPVQPYAREPASVVWGAIHGVSILSALVTVLIGFATGLMYLRQAWRLKHKRPPGPGLRLPSLEWLHQANSRALLVATLLLGLGVFSGYVLLRVRTAEVERGAVWRDPVIVSTLLTFLWLAASLAFTAAYRPLRQGPKVVYLTLVSLALLLFAMGAGLFLRTEHRGGLLRRPVGAATASLPQPTFFRV